MSGVSKMEDSSCVSNSGQNKPLSEGELTTLVNQIDPDVSDFEIEDLEDEFEPQTAILDEGHNSSWDSSDEEPLSNIRTSQSAGGRQNVQETYRRSEITNLKVIDDNSVSEDGRKTDRFWKVMLMLDIVRQSCLQTPRPQNVSIDEQMIPFYGHMSMRQYVRGKPCPVGLKLFVMASASGLPLDFVMYQGKGTGFHSVVAPTPENLDIGGKAVLKLCDTLPAGHLSSLIALKKAGRGSHDQIVRQDDKVSSLKWYDSKGIYLASTQFGVQPVGECRRWSKKDNKYILVERPHVVSQYNTFMGGVDLLDRDSSGDEDDNHEHISSKRRKIIPIPHEASRKSNALHLPENLSDKQKNRSKCRYPGCKYLTYVQCSDCKVFLCFNNDRNCYKQFHS
ncbi:hypothetical protein ANN_13173 [Periplaneta americana]|uniref:PiggyBac transposable element-derived protein domain-containing protein n=1 Tax=Periplaneta americana TaxID=6978 RepID=A0ABQ8TL83_PERAM|nr:hypothetical protein ANN_13173 [Periplaneta americana]